MCHGRIAPKSTSAFASASVGHGVFLRLVILSTLLGDGLASGESQPAFCGGGDRRAGGGGQPQHHPFSRRLAEGIPCLCWSSCQGSGGWGLLCCDRAGSQPEGFVQEPAGDDIVTSSPSGHHGQDGGVEVRV